VPEGEERRRRIVFAGAGSTQFAPLLLSDMCRSNGLGRATVVLHDIDGPRLERTVRLAERLFPRASSELRAESTLSADEAVRGADVVICSIEIDRFPRWELDRTIPERLGIRHALGENGGPGGLFHALRMIPGAVRLARRTEELAPGALILNLTNPMTRICQGIADATSARAVGLCHEITSGREAVASALGVPEPELRVEAAGLNHFTFFTRIEDSAGKDLYPELRARYRSHPEVHLQDDRLLVSELLRVTGSCCVTNDSHAGEYLRFGHLWECSWAPDMPPLDFYPYYRSEMDRLDAQIARVVDEGGPVDELLELESGEQVVPIIERLFAGEVWRSDALNLPNSSGQLPGLPPWAVVETPGFVDGEGGHGSRVDDLPLWLNALCHTQATISRLTAHAALHGDRQAALEALLIDPTVPDIVTAERVFSELFEAHRDYLPAFQ